jgi:hypothetical protein
MEQPIENADSTNGEEIDPSIEAADTSGLDAAALQAKLTETEQKNRQLFERAKKAEGFVLKEGKWVKAEKQPAPNGEVAPKATTGELDETQLDFLDLKGINDSDDIDVISKVMQRTGQTVRQALKDDYVMEKLKANQARREVANAMPSGTKRSGAGAMGVDAALAKYEATGELPTDFELRSQVINLKEAKTSGTAPPWRR